MSIIHATTAIGLGAAVAVTCAVASPGCRLDNVFNQAAGNANIRKTGANQSLDTSLRRCRRCGVSKSRECFTPKQWARPDPTKRTCNPCCAALDAERIAREQAAGVIAAPRAWSGRHNKPSRGKAPRHSVRDKQPIIVAENIDDYRAAIAIHVRNTDVVLEVGCHQGCSTVLMDNAATRAVGIDKGQHVLSEGKRLHPQLALHDIDATDISALRRLNNEEGPFDVIFIDIGGGSVSSVGSFWALIEAYAKILVPAPRIFIVKSFKLAELLHRCSLMHTDICDNRKVDPVIG